MHVENWILHSKSVYKLFINEIYSSSDPLWPLIVCKSVAIILQFEIPPWKIPMLVHDLHTNVNFLFTNSSSFPRASTGVYNHKLIERWIDCKHIYYLTNVKIIAVSDNVLSTLFLPSIFNLNKKSAGPSVSNEILPIKAHLLDWSNKTQCHYIPIVNTIQHQCSYIVHIEYSFER